MARLRGEFGASVVGEEVKVAILIGMIPKELQDIACQMGTMEEEAGFEEIRDKVMAVAGHRMSRRIPKEESGVNEVGWDWGGNEGEGEEECRMCGEAKEEPAHIIRECEAFWQERLEAFNCIEKLCQQKKNA